MNHLLCSIGFRFRVENDADDFFNYIIVIYKAIIVGIMYVFFSPRINYRFDMLSRWRDELRKIRIGIGQKSGLIYSKKLRMVEMKYEFVRATYFLVILPN